ncbi:MAG: hypothetical protein NT049_16280 [Planctomycetota bacterium]|nr:hypothetical protein [Planctomycetota bacterium]
MDIPAGETAVHELAAALHRPAHAHAGEANAAPVLPLAAPPAGDRSPTPLSGSRVTSSRSNGSNSGTKTTTVDRLIARSSPYKSLRLLAAVAFGVGAVLAVLIAVGGLVGLVLVSLRGEPLIGVGVFMGAAVVAAGLFFGARMLNEMLGLLADMGDRMRQTTQLLEDLAGRPRDNGV